jgi:hypothetical protein
LQDILDRFEVPEEYGEDYVAVLDEAMDRAWMITSQMGWHISSNRPVERRSKYPPIELSWFDRLEHMADDEEIPCTLAPGTGTTTYKVDSQEELDALFPGTSLKL